jgi:8-oxo-dGTP diphosphatase
LAIPPGRWKPISLTSNFEDSQIDLELEVDIMELVKIEEYKKKNLSPLRQATLCFLVRENEVLLAMKKRGFGKGRWNGSGGKPIEKEEIEVTAVRETNEELGVTPRNLRRVATLNFYFPHHSDWNQQVVVYFSEEWEGEPAETEEMAPKWYKKDELPFDSMWPDDIHWLPLVLRGKIIEAEFLFGEEDVVLDSKIREINERV